MKSPVIPAEFNASWNVSFQESVGKQQVLSSSDQSDIMTLGELKDGEHTEEEEEEAAAREELYLGTSCSSHYTFTATETGRTERSSRFLLQTELLSDHFNTSVCPLPEQTCC